MAREMKDSGIAWIGEIPREWELRKGKFLFRQRSEKGNRKELQLLSPTQKYGVIPQSLYEELSGMKAVKLDESAEYSALKSIYEGDFCISLRSFQGGFEYSRYNGVVSPAYQVFYRSVSLCDDYYRYMFKDQGFIAKMTSFTRTFRDGKSISFSDFADSLVPVPPLAEQRRIADFLDAECARIDAVIEQTRASIEEYKKLKQSVITQAVTKGIRPGRKMKDSGIEWIGEIPEEWQLFRLKDYYRFEKGKNAAVYTQSYIAEHEGDFPVFSGQTENNGIMGKINTYDYDIDECLFTTTVGAKVMTPNVLRGKFSLSQNCLIMLQTQKCNNRYIYYALFPLFRYAKSLIPSYMQPSLRVSDLNKYSFYAPKYEEQDEIADYLDERCCAIDELIEQKEKMLSDLESYKKSLIFEYVTGKKEVV